MLSPKDLVYYFYIFSYYVTEHANRGGILCFWPDADANLLTGMTLATGDKLDTKLVRSQHTTGKYVINHSLQFFNRQDEPFEQAQESKVHPWSIEKARPSS